MTQANAWPAYHPAFFVANVFDLDGHILAFGPVTCDVSEDER